MPECAFKRFCLNAGIILFISLLGFVNMKFVNFVNVVNFVNFRQLLSTGKISAKV